MKKRSITFGFEFLFSAGIITALALPQLIFAQNKKDTIKEINITIKGSDTTFNGKNLKAMTAGEKQQALAEINKTVRPKSRSQQREFSLFNNPDSGNIRYYAYKIDSALKYSKDKIDINIDGLASLPKMDGFSFNSRPVRVRTMRMENTQNFDFNNTDKEGISTHVSYRISDAFMDAAKKVAGVTKSDLDLQDLTITPLFSAGKTVIAFTMPIKAAAEVQLTDSEGKAIWKDKAASANFSKTFTWGMNGVYYLVVKQAGKAAVKRIVKE